MALETLKSIKKIDGYEVCHLDERISKEEFEKVKKYIIVNHRENTITFKIQNNPIKESGENGCQVDTILATCHIIITGLNKKFKSPYNDMACNNIFLALAALDKRKQDRIKRNVEGKNMV